MLRFDSIRTQSIHTTGSQQPWNNDTRTFLVLKTWPQTSVDSSEAGYDSTRFDDRSRSALPEVNIREIMIQEPSSFLKCGNKLQSIRCELVLGMWSYCDSIRSIRCESKLVKPNRFTGIRYSWYTSMGGVKLLRFESIRLIRCESNLVKPNRFTGSRYSWYTSMGGVKLCDSSRFDRFVANRTCKAESFHRKSIFLVYKYVGCEVMRFESIRSIC